MNKTQTDWDKMLDYVLFAYRTTINKTIKESPFFLLYGRDPILPSDLLFETVKTNRFSDENNEENDKINYKLN